MIVLGVRQPPINAKTILMSETDQNKLDEKPPIFNTWNQMYAFVLILHAVIILLFYLFTNAYS